MGIPIDTCRRAVPGRAVVLPSVLAAVAALPGAASAETVEVPPTRVHDAAFCVGVATTFSPTGATGQADISRNSGAGHCAVERPHAPGTVAQRIVLHFRRSPNASSGVCAVTAWTYNRTRSALATVRADLPSAAPCGPGQYAAATQAYVWAEGGWRGGDGGPTPWLDLPESAR